MALSLTKDSVRVLVSPAVPPRPAVAPVAFRMYAAPLPVGWRYEPFYAGSLSYPRDLASFLTWTPQIKLAPVEYEPGSATFTFVALADLVTSGYSTGLPDGAYPVYGLDDGGEMTVLTGYMVPSAGTGVELPARHWGPLPLMEFVTFPDVATEGDYGYPAGPGPFTGYFDVPTLDGVQRVTSIYRKDFRGVLLRDPSPALPAYCTQGGPARVVALANFPGRAAVSGTPAEYRIDGQPGWNSGADSESALGGDCRVTFYPNVVAAVALGLCAASRADSTDINQLTHAFAFDQPSGPSVRYCVLEGGRRITSYATTAADQAFVIERVDGVVTYKVGGTTVHTSLVGSYGSVRVGSGLYFAGDGIY